MGHMKRVLTTRMVGVVVVGLLGGSTWASPKDRASDRALVPTGLEESIKASFPSYRVPEEKDITGGWVVGRKPGSSAFICLGDFNGDGIEDAAIILIGEQAWMLVVFEQDRLGKYRPAFVGRPKTKQELGLYWENEILLMPQQVLLRTVRKGETWAPEAGDDPHLGRLRVDAIALTTKPKPNADFASLVIWKGGRYQQVFSEPLVELPANAP